MLAVGGVVTVSVLPVFLLGGLAVQMRADLGFSVSMLGLAGSAFFAVSALVARPLAAVTERVGPTVSLRIAAAGSAVSLFALAAVPSTAWLLVALCCAGVPNALSQPASNEMIMSRVPLGRRGFAFAVKQSAIPLSTLVAGLAVPVVALTLGWRWAFVLAGVLGLTAALAVPRMPWAGRGRAERAARGSTGLLLVALAAVTGMGAAAANAMGTFVTVSAVDVGYDEAAAGLTLALGSAVGLVARLVAGAVADRARPDLLRVVMVMLALGSVGYALLALGHPVTFLVGLLLGFGAGWAWPGVFNFAVAARFPDRVTTATSVTQTGVYVGAAAGPLLFGLISQHAGITTAWVAACAMTLAATLTLLGVRRSSTSMLPGGGTAAGRAAGGGPPTGAGQAPRAAGNSRSRAGRTAAAPRPAEQPADGHGHGEHQNQRGTDPAGDGSRAHQRGAAGQQVGHNPADQHQSRDDVRPRDRHQQPAGDQDDRDRDVEYRRRAPQGLRGHDYSSRGLRSRPLCEFMST